MKSRLFRVLRKYAIVIGLGIAYLIFVLCTGVGIPCAFYEITGFKCPACGISRMIVSLVRFDYKAAFNYNPFIFITGPIIIFCFAYSDVRYIKNGDSSLGKFGALLWIEIFAALVFGILRNIL